MIQIEIGADKAKIGSGASRIKAKLLADLCKRFLVLSELSIDGAKDAHWYVVPRIRLRPKFIGLASLSQVANHGVGITRLDGKPLPLAHALAQLVSLPNAVRRQAVFPDTQVAQPERKMGHREIRVEPNCSLEQGCCGHGVHVRNQFLAPQAVNLYGIERGRSSLL